MIRNTQNHLKFNSVFSVKTNNNLLFVLIRGFKLISDFSVFRV